MRYNLVTDLRTKRQTDSEVIGSRFTPVGTDPKNGQRYCQKHILPIILLIF